MKDAEARGRSSRNKGKAGENTLAKHIRDFYGYDVRRGHVFDGESDMVGLDGIHPEVKRVEKLSLAATMEQAVSEAERRQDGIPTIFWRRNRERWKVTMRLGDLMVLAYGLHTDDDYLVTMSLPDWMDLYGEWRERDGSGVYPCGS